MKQKTLLLSKVLFISLLPLFIAGAFYALATITVHLKGILSNHESSPPSKLEGLSEQIGTLSLSVYDSYFHFMVVMGILNLVWRLLTSPRTMNHHSPSLESHSTKKHHTTSYLQRSLVSKFISFSLVYLLLSQIKIFTSQPSNHLIQEFLRVLEEEQQPQQGVNDPKVIFSTPQTITSEKLSLSIGKVLGSLDLDLGSFVISNDGNYAFALGRTHWILKVIDISDLESPFIKASLEFNIENWFFGRKNLILNPDGNTLYISDFKSLQIVNVTDPLLPNALGSCQEKSLPDPPSVYSSSTGQPFTTLALSKDERTLFVGGFGLQIFNVSVLAMPPEVLFKNIHNCNDNKCMNTTAITLSADSQHLFLANGTLNIYQISSKEKLPQLISSYESQSLITSIFLIDDDKTAYITGTYDQSNVTIEKVDISNIQDPKRHSFTYLSLLKPTYKPPYIITASPKKTQLYILVDSNTIEYFQGCNILVYDITKDSLINNDQSLLTNAFSISISADGKKVFASSSSKFLILELFLDYPNQRTMSLSQDILGFFNPGSYWMKIFPSPNHQIVFVNARDFVSGESWFEIWNITKRFSPTLIASYKQQQQWLSPSCPVTMTADFTKAFLYSIDNKLTALDLTDLTNPVPYASYAFDDGISVESLSLSQNGHRVFALIQRDSDFSLMILDFSDPNSVKPISTIQAVKAPKDDELNTLLLGKDERTIFIVHQSVEIYDVSDPFNPKFLSSFPVARNEPHVNFYSASLSRDSKTLFVEFYEQNFSRKLAIFNVTDPNSVIRISDTILPMYDIGYWVPFQISPDSKTGYVYQRSAMVIFSLTDLAAPSVSGIVSLVNSSYTGFSIGFSLSFDGKIGFALNRDQEILMLDLQLTR